MSYGHLCVACHHLGSRHLVKPRDMSAKPYRCLDCDCRIDRDAPMLPLSRSEYEQRRDAGLPTYETGPR
jgi:DNA-directed RNA polymerase subunit RPC12/RpoP